MLPMEGRGVIAYRDARLRVLTLVTSTQFPYSGQTGLSECLGIEHGAPAGHFARCRRRLWLQGIALPRRGRARLAGAEGRLSGALAGGQPRAFDRERQLPRASLWRSPATRPPTAKSIGIDCTAHVDAGAYSSYPISSSAGGRADRQSFAGSLCFLGVPLRCGRGCHQQMPYPCLTAGSPELACVLQSKRSWMPSRAKQRWSRTKSGCAIWSAPSRCRSIMWSANISIVAITPNACGARWRPSA